jgi:hypothetical protein
MQTTSRTPDLASFLPPRAVDDEGVPKRRRSVKFDDRSELRDFVGSALIGNSIRLLAQFQACV